MFTRSTSPYLDRPILKRFIFIIGSVLVLLFTPSVAGFPLDRFVVTMFSASSSSKMNINNNDKSDNNDKNNWKQLPKPDPSNTFIYRDTLRSRATWNPDVYKDSWELYQRFLECSDNYLDHPIRTALTCLDHALRLYGPQSVVCSFNGGKDAVVILHLLRAAVAAYYHHQQQPQQKPSENDTNNDDNPKTTKNVPILRPRVVYFDHKDEFPEILEFVNATVHEFDLDMVAFAQDTKFQDGLKVLVDNNIVASGSSDVVLPMAFVLGTRLTDPNAVGQQPFAPSSHYMPPFMRVNPILHWTYGHVWHFLRLFQLSYCSLYDKGYTSLGTVKDTLPCPALAVAGYQQSDGSIPKYWPAYMLRDWDQERAGRIIKKKSVTATTSSSHKPKKLIKNGNATTDESETTTERSGIPSVSSIGHLSTLSEGRRIVEAMPPPAAAAQNTDSSTEGVDAIPESVSYSSDTVTQKSAGLLIIGDEILKGLTQDVNTQVAAVALRSQNVVLKCVAVISDDLEEIAKEIRRLQNTVDVVITSGGVGPTHDDVTLKGIAAALNCEMEFNEEMAQLLREKMNQSDETNGAELTEAQRKMAFLPTCSKLRYLSRNPKDWPVLQCKNIFVLPGVPEFFAQKIENVAAYLSCQLERTTALKVVLKVDENSIVPILNEVVENHPNVSIGSYPFVSHPDFKTVITVEGRWISGGRSNSTIIRASMVDLNQKSASDCNVQMALNDLINRLPEGSVLRVDNDDMMMS